MKILVSKNQILNILEQTTVGYTPERIDEFVQKGLKEVEFFQKQYEMFHTQMLNININEVFEDINGIKSLLDNMKLVETNSTNLSNRYFDVVQKYDYMDFPPNVKKLDDIYTNLENVSDDIGNIQSIVEAIYESIEHFINWNQEKIDRDTEHQDLIKKIRG